MTPKQTKNTVFVFADVSAGRADNYPLFSGLPLESVRYERKIAGQDRRPVH